MAKLPPVKTWPARYKTDQIEIHEDDNHNIWVSSKEVRKVLPRLRTDSQLLKVYPGRFKKLDDGPRVFFSETALTEELQYNRSQDALMFLQWLQKSAFYSASRKRGDAHILAPMPHDNRSGYEDTKPGIDEELHIPVRVVPPPAKSLRPKPVAKASTVNGARGFIAEPLARLWRGEEGLTRTIFYGAMVSLVFEGIVALAIRAIADPNHYTGSYVLRQWVVLFLIVALIGPIVFWCVSVGRCTLRRHHEGHSFLTSVVVFVLGLSFTLNLITGTLGIAQEWVEGWWTTLAGDNVPAFVTHDPLLGRIVVKGAFGFGSYKVLAAALEKKPKLTLVEIESPVGFVVEGMAMAKLIQEHRMDTVSFDRCASACTILLAAGQDRYLGPDVRVGFHRSGVFGTPISASWTRTDHELADYYLSRNTSESFVGHALDTPSNKIWVPTHAEMFAAGYATKAWNERKSGY
ncbi:MAG: hypothetical protein ABIZ09_07120 [Rhodoferax sp.]